MEDFTNLPFTSYSWIHFEGRNVENVALMAEHLAKNSFKSGISLEVEKLGRNYEPILPHVDVVFISKEYAISKGYCFTLKCRVEEFQGCIVCLVFFPPKKRRFFPPEKIESVIYKNIFKRS